MIEYLPNIAALAVAALLVTITLLPFWKTHLWWVRIWDFPRVQIAVALVGGLGLAFVLEGWPRWTLAAVLATCLAYQSWRIFPYTPLARAEMRFASASENGVVTLLAANVLMENRDYERLHVLIGQVNPDVLLLMETDQAWVAAMEPSLSRFETVLREPRANYYGMVFATRLRVIEAKIAYLTADDTPSVFAELESPNGLPFRFVGLHPQPPIPGVDSDERDTQILYAARFARRSGMPLVAMGDFNDAAWSDTAQSFKTLGRYLDPRVGRGLFASFSANSWLLRCPIDQIYVTEDVAMVSLRLGPHVGSDHYPVIAQLKVDPDLASQLNERLPAANKKDEADWDRRAAAYGEKLAGLIKLRTEGE